MTTALDLLSGLVVDGSETRWGEIAADFQVADARAVLEPGDGPRLHFLTRPRGGSKTTDAAGMALAALLTQLGPFARCYAAAADLEQAARIVDAAGRLVARTPGLPGAVRVEAGKVTAAGGATLQALAADGPGAYGLLPSFVIVDELAQWPTTRAARTFWTALVSAMAKVPGARLVVLTSAGDPAHWSAQVREQARSSPAWRLHEVPGPVPWVSETALAEQRALLLPSEYARLHENVWTSAEDSLTTAEDLAACVTLAGPREPEPGRRYVLGLDIGLKSDRTVAAVCHAEAMPRGQADGPTERIVLDRLAVWSGSRFSPVKLAEVEEWVEQAVRTYRGAELVVDPWQAVGLAAPDRSRRARPGVHVLVAIRGPPRQHLAQPLAQPRARAAGRPRAAGRAGQRSVAGDQPGRRQDGPRRGAP